MALHLDMMHQHTKFGHNRFNGSEDLIEMQKHSLSMSTCKWLQKLQWFRRYHPDKIKTGGQTDTLTDRKGDSKIPSPPPIPLQLHYVGYKK